MPTTANRTHTLKSPRAAELSPHLHILDRCCRRCGGHRSRPDTGADTTIAGSATEDECTDCSGIRIDYTRFHNHSRSSSRWPICPAWWPKSVYHLGYELRPCRKLCLLTGCGKDFRIFRLVCALDRQRRHAHTPFPIALTLCCTLITRSAREAARLGAVASAAHNLCFQLGVATTQLCESLAIATQTLLARELGGETARRAEEASKLKANGDESTMRTLAARHIISRGFGVGLLVSGSLSLVTLVNRHRVVAGLTTLPEVRHAADHVMPLVLVCQTLKGLAYPVSGALMGECFFSCSNCAAATVIAFDRSHRRLLVRF